MDRPIIKNHSQPCARVKLIRPCSIDLVRERFFKERQQRSTIILGHAYSVGFVGSKDSIPLATARFYFLERWCISTFCEKLHSECFVVTIDCRGQLDPLLSPVVEENESVKTRVGPREHNAGGLSANVLSNQKKRANLVEKRVVKPALCIYTAIILYMTDDGFGFRNREFSARLEQAIVLVHTFIRHYPNPPD
jgi:hypothetical protein